MVRSKFWLSFALRATLHVRIPIVRVEESLKPMIQNEEFTDLLDISSSDHLRKL